MAFDEATVAEKNGIKINLVEGEKMNIKITHPLDLQVAEFFLVEQAAGRLHKL